MQIENLTLPNLKEVGADLDLVKAEIVRRYELFPELVQALEDCQYTIRALSEDYDSKDSYIQAQSILTRAKEIKI